MKLFFWFHFHQSDGDWFQVGKVNERLISVLLHTKKIVLKLKLGSYWAKFASCPWSRAFTSAFSFKRLRASESSFVSWSICSFSFSFSASWRSIKALKRSFAVRNVLRKAPAWRVMSDSLDAIWLIRYSMIKKPCVDFAAETYNREKLALKLMASYDRRCQTNLNSTQWRYVFCHASVSCSALSCNFSLKIQCFSLWFFIIKQKSSAFFALHNYLASPIKQKLTGIYLVHQQQCLSREWILMNFLKSRIFRAQLLLICVYDLKCFKFQRFPIKI